MFDSMVCINRIEHSVIKGVVQGKHTSGRMRQNNIPVTGTLVERYNISRVEFSRFNQLCPDQAHSLPPDTRGLGFGYLVHWILRWKKKIIPS